MTNRQDIGQTDKDYGLEYWVGASAARKIRHLTIIFGFAALGLAVGALDAGLNKLSDYEQQVTETSPDLSYWETKRVANMLRTEDNFRAVRNGFGIGLAVGLGLAGINSLRRRPKPS